jgi:hypothetical protein
MSFGRPPSIGDNFKVNPPQRGSFPLDHEGMQILNIEEYGGALLTYPSAPSRRLQSFYVGVLGMSEDERK